MTYALDMPEIMSYIYSKSWKLQFSASSSIIIIEDYYLQTFLHSLAVVVTWLIYPLNNQCIHFIYNNFGKRLYDHILSARLSLPFR